MLALNPNISMSLNQLIIVICNVLCKREQDSFVPCQVGDRKTRTFKRIKTLKKSPADNQITKEHFVIFLLLVHLFGSMHVPKFIYFLKQ